MTSPTDSVVDSDNEKSSRPISRRELRRAWQREEAAVEGAPKSIFDLEYVPPARPYVEPNLEPPAEPFIEERIEQRIEDFDEVRVEAEQPEAEMPEDEAPKDEAPKDEAPKDEAPKHEFGGARDGALPPPVRAASVAPSTSTLLFSRIPDDEAELHEHDDRQESNAALSDDSSPERGSHRKPVAVALGIAAAFGLMLTFALPAFDLVYVDPASAESGQVLAAAGSDQTPIDLESFETVDELEAAAEQALNRADTFTNNPDADVQYPFSSGVPLTDGFGPRSFPVAGFHDAQDFGAGYGGAIRSIADGTVIESGATPDGCGFGLKISHKIDGQSVVSRYCHLATAPVVAVGDRVRVGQFVALVGSSGLSFGAHLHLVVEVDGKAVDPMVFIAKYNKPRSEW